MASRITCITKPHPHSALEHITNVGGIRPNGGSFYITREQCARDIHSGDEPYFVHVNNWQIQVEAYVLHGQWFIKTRPDATQKDNLLSLPQCH